MFYCVLLCCIVSYYVGPIRFRHNTLHSLAFLEREKLILLSLSQRKAYLNGNDFLPRAGSSPERELFLSPLKELKQNKESLELMNQKVAPLPGTTGRKAESRFFTKLQPPECVQPQTTGPACLLCHLNGVPGKAPAPSKSRKNCNLKLYCPPLNRVGVRGGGGWSRAQLPPKSG